MSIEDRVAEHYTVGGLAAALLDGLREAGADAERFEASAAAPVDEFHIGGRPATEYFGDLLAFPSGARILDVGCGLGGAARYLATRFDCDVTGIDLTPEYIEVAQLVSERTGLAESTRFEVGNACAMPFPDRHFDGATTIHVAMNIHDRPALYAEIARVLAPGARLGIYDVMRGPGGELTYPVPWADDPATSHLTTPDETRDLVTQAGFEVLEFEDRTTAGLDFFRQMQSLVAERGMPPLGLHLLLGESFERKMTNMTAGLKAGHVLPGMLIARRI